MSRENVEALRWLLAQVGDGENPEALYERLHPDIELVTVTGDLEAGRYVGHAAVRRYFRKWAGTWENWHFHPEQLIEVGDDRVVVGLYQRGRGRGSGIEVENHPGQVWTFRDGLVVRWEHFGSLSEALEAVGLRE